MTSTEHNEHNNITESKFENELSDRYFAYAISTIMSRSLPDVRDGLKPVHRRILFDMMQLKLNPNTPYKKSARVVGDVIGKYHPHGDQAVYDSMVRLAQEFSVRYPLIDGQGNFGSIDGDNAAAMRYTESRLTEIATSLLKDLELNTVTFKPNYDDQESEPAILPAAFPNILANGAEGIAVGMATSIPPHNLDELCEALIALNNDANLSITDLTNFIQGPDFPTGGIITTPKEQIISAYKTGKGSFKVRSKWHKEDLNHGLYQIVITEIPYQVQKSKLIEKIAQLFKDKKLPLLDNIRDESAEDIRIIIEPKNRTVDPDILMASLFSLSDLETKISLNMNVLNKDSVPMVMNLKEMLLAFLDHRDVIILNRSNFKLEKILNRLEILDGLLIAYLNLDDIINIIRYEDHPKQVLITKYKLTEIQVEAILNMKLRSLRKLEELTIKQEYEKLELEKSELEKIINNQKYRKKILAKEIKEIQKKFGKTTIIGKRRSIFCEQKNDLDINIESFIEKEAITIICSKFGWIRSIKGTNINYKDVKYKEGDEQKFLLESFTTNKIIIFSKKGKFYTIKASELSSGRGYGESIRFIIDLDDDDEIIDLFNYGENRDLLVTLSNGKGFIINEESILASTKAGKKILNTSENNYATLCIAVTGNHCAIIGTNRKLLIIPTEDIPRLKKGSGVTLQKYKDAKLSDLKFFNIENGLEWSLGEKIRKETDLRSWLGKRGLVGKIPPFGFPRNNKFGN